MMGRLNRIQQVIKYGWKHSGEISKKEFSKKKRLLLFFDIFVSYERYRMWSNQYKKERFWSLDKEQRTSIGLKYKSMNSQRELWVKDFYENRRFISKWSRYSLERSARQRERRNKAYSKRYNIGEGVLVEHHVEISRQHHLPGTIVIGKNVRLCKNLFIDYSGDVVIEDGVTLTNGVIIESHYSDFEAYKEGRDVNVPTKLLIRENAFIGSRAIILESCNYIGKNAIIGAGAVVTKDIPDYAVAVGVPAKVVKYVKEGVN